MDEVIHPAFKAGSANLNIRNGVGILPDNSVVFAMSKKEISFYDFAVYFKNLGCKNALYLDGFVSRTYLPAENWTQTDGNFWSYDWNNRTPAEITTLLIIYKTPIHLSSQHFLSSSQL